MSPAGLAPGSPDASSIEISDLREALLLLRSGAESAAFGGRISFVRVSVINLRHENDCSFVCVIGLRHGLFRTQHPTLRNDKIANPGCNASKTYGNSLDMDFPIPGYSDWPQIVRRKIHYL